MRIDKNLLQAALLTITPEFPYVSKWVDNLITNKGLPGFVQTWKKLKAWAIKLISGENRYKEDWFSCSLYLGYKIPSKYKELFQLLVIVLERDKVRPSYHNKIMIRKILSVLNLHHTVFGPYKPDVVNQVNAALQQPVIPEHHKLWVKTLRIACRALGISLRSKPMGLSPTGQSVAIRPGINGSWLEFVSQTFPDDWIESKLGPNFGFETNLGSSYPRPRVKPRGAWQGNLTVIGESGGKTRLVMVGNPLVQQKLTALKRELLELNRCIPTDCTFDQSSGHKFIVQKQSEGVKLFCTDLKDCTWNLPGSLQREILVQLGCMSELVNLMFTSLVHNPLDGKLHPIEKGQAMGLGPSFPLFSLLHNLILWCCCRIEGVSPVNTFRVLGDDVVISHEGVYRLYLSFLHDYQVPISSQKSLNSSVCGEFAGKLFFKGVDITPIKWRWLSWNSLSQLYWTYRSLWGMRAHTLLRSGKDRISLSVLGPIPKRFGGLNLRVSGLINSPRVDLLRKGLLEGIIERRNRGDSSGVVSIPNRKVKKPVQLGPDGLRKLDSYLNSDLHLRTEWGLLPQLTPNPMNFLNQVGITIRGLPVREEFDPNRGYYLRFRRSKEKSPSWKSVLHSLLNEEVTLETNQEIEDISKVLSQEERDGIRHFFTAGN